MPCCELDLGKWAVFCCGLKLLLLFETAALSKPAVLLTVEVPGCVCFSSVHHTHFRLDPAENINIIIINNNDNDKKKNQTLNK